MALLNPSCRSDRSINFPNKSTPANIAIAVGHTAWYGIEAPELECMPTQRSDHPNERTSAASPEHHLATIWQRHWLCQPNAATARNRTTGDVTRFWTSCLFVIST